MKGLKVVLYARVSTRDKDQDPETQLIKLRKFAEGLDRARVTAVP